MAIVNLTPDNEGPENQLCAGRWYQFEQTETAITYEWCVISSPQAVNNLDVEFTAQYGKTTFLRVPIDGSYCFTTKLGLIA